MIPNNKRCLSTDNNTLIVLSFAVLAFLPFVPALRAGVPIAFNDLSQMYFFREFIAHGLSHGHMPLWMPNALCGYPFIGNIQTQAYYPLSFIYLLGPARITISLFLMTHIFLTGTLQFYYLKILLRRRGAAYLGAICLMLGGHIITAVNAEHPVRIAALTWMPIILLAVHNAVTRRSLPWALAAAFLFALDLLAGFPQISLYIVLVAMLQVIMSRCLSGRLTVTGLFGDYLVFGAGCAFSMALAAFQLLPTAALLRECFRGDQSAAVAALGSLGPHQLLTIALPNAFGSPAYHNSVYGSVFWEGIAYAGVAPLMLLIVPTSDRRLICIRRFFIVIGLFFAILALGRHTPLWSAFRAVVPLAKTLRAPCRATCMVQFALSVLAACGLVSLGNLREKSGARPGRWPYIYVVVLAGIILSFVGTVVFRARLMAMGQRFVASHYSLAEAPEKFEKIAGLFSLQQSGILVAALFMLVGAIVIAAFLRGKISLAAVGVGMVLLTLVDLGIFWYPLVRPGDFYRRTAPVKYADALGSDRSSYRILPLQESLFERNSGMLNGFRNAQGYDAFILRRFVSLVCAINRTQFGMFVPNTPDIKNADAPIVDMLNVRYVISSSHLDSPKLRLKAARDGGVHIYENTKCLPRAWLVGKATYVTSDDAALERISSTTFDPATEVVLVGQEKNQSGGSVGGQCSVTRYEPDRISVRAICKSPSYLVLSEMFFPGWIARVNGVKQEVLCGNYALRVIKLDPGISHIDFVFEPRSVKIGVLVSAVAFAVGILSLIAFAFTRRTSRENNMVNGESV